jgi:D-alanine-D-alanine ligase
MDVEAFVEVFKEKLVGVLMGGLSAEREISLQTGEAVSKALRDRGYETVCLDVDRQICSRLAQAKVEVAFIALHGRWGEDGCIQGLLESLGIPYTGSGVLASGLAMDKVQAKRLFDGAGLPTAAWRFPATSDTVRDLGLPLVVKPRAEGSTVGLSVIHDPSELETAIEKAGGEKEAMAEQYVAGREIAVGVLGHGDAARCLGSVEIKPADGLYDYEAKYHRDDTEYLAPAPVPEAIQRRLAELTLAVHRLLGCGGATRTDFLWDEQDDPKVLELNTIPGMTSHSLLPMIAKLEGLTFEDLVETILLDAALKN